MVHLEIKTPDSNIEAESLRIDNLHHLKIASDHIKKGNIGAIAFNGIYGLFGDIDNLAVVQRIMEIKNRPKGKGLIATIAPEYLKEHVDFTRLLYSHEQIVELQKSLHALGLILPASNSAPNHLVSPEGKTLLNIWTEYQPLRQIVELSRKLGIRGLVGTSANKSGQGTHYLTHELRSDLGTELDFIVAADFSNFPSDLQKSTSVVDLSGPKPRLHRIGNVPELTIKQKLSELNFPELIVDEEKLVIVTPR